MGKSITDTILQEDPKIININKTSMNCKNKLKSSVRGNFEKAPPSDWPEGKSVAYLLIFCEFATKFDRMKGSELRNCLYQIVLRSCVWDTDTRGPSPLRTVPP